MAKYKAAIQFILRIKFFCCIYHFKKQRKFEIEMTDIWEKNAQSHQETINFLREMKETATKLRYELNYMKTAFNETVTLKMHQGNAVLSQKKTRDAPVQEIMGVDDRENFWGAPGDKDKGERKSESKIEEDDSVNEDVFLKPPPAS